MLLALYVIFASSWDAMLSRNWRHFSMVASVGAACSDARVLRGVSIVPSTAHAKNKNTPVISWMNFFLALSNKGFCQLVSHIVLLLHISS